MSSFIEIISNIFIIYYTYVLYFIIYYTYLYFFGIMSRLSLDYVLYVII